MNANASNNNQASVNEAKASSEELLNSKEMKKTTKKVTGLKPRKGDMYSFVSHTWNPIKGICEHDCSYCYMKRNNLKAVRLDAKEMTEDLEKGHFVFVGSSTDVFAKNIPSSWITDILNYCDKFDNRYLFQSKNPERFLEFIDHPVFKKSVICTTIESNRPYADCNAPSIEDRVLAMELIKSEYPTIETYVTAEPIMDFDMPEMTDLIKRCNPVQVNIGADSKGNNLPEPTKENLSELIAELSKFTTVKQKNNLDRIFKKEDPELVQAKDEKPKSNLMVAQIMDETETGYEYRYESRRFGLIKENRPIKESIVNDFLQTIHSGKYKKSQSIIAVEAVDVIENYNIIDLEDNPISAEDATEYLIVLDGQHRITAFSKLNASRSQEEQIVIPNVHVEKGLTNIREFLADINLVGRSWDSADKICVSAIATGSKILAKICELIKRKYTATTASLICTGKRITAPQLKKMIVSGDISSLPKGKEEEKALAKAEKFLTITTSIVGNDISLLRKRFFINGFNSASKFFDEKTVFEALRKLTLDDFKTTKEDLDFQEKLAVILSPQK